MITEIVEALQLLIESSLSDVNTAIPGEIVSYDAKRNRAVVRPSLPKALSNDDKLDPPQIIEVPVVWHAANGGDASLTMPLKAGDGVGLSFQQRSLEGWLNGNKAKPDDPRQFDLSDCVAHPGLSHNGTVADPNNVVLKYKKSNLTIDPMGNIILGNDLASITIQQDGGIIIKAQYMKMQNPGGNGYINIDNGGNMTIAAQSVAVQTPSHSFALESHRHINVQTGSATS